MNRIQWKNECIYQSINEWINGMKWTNDQTNQWTNEWIIECMYSLMGLSCEISVKHGHEQLSNCLKGIVSFVIAVQCCWLIISRIKKWNQFKYLFFYFDCPLPQEVNCMASTQQFPSRQWLFIQTRIKMWCNWGWRWVHSCSFLFDVIQRRC